MAEDIRTMTPEDLMDLWTQEGYGAQIVFYRIKGQGLRILGPAPRFTSMSVQTLVEAAGSLDVTGEVISIWDQVEYRVIGWDPELKALILSLAADDRPEEWKEEING
jgi:hypothetical protein